jgi:pilus assembly protein CpaC
MKPLNLRRIGTHCIAGASTLALTAAPVALNAAPGASSGATVATQDAGVVLLAIGQSRVVNLTGTMSDVIIANPDVVDVHVRSQHQLYLLAKGPGQTDVTVTNSAGKPIYKAVVRVGNNLTSVDQMLKLAMPDADITISTLNNTLLLTGTIAAPEDGAEAERLVTAFVGAGTTVISRLRTATPLTVNLQVRIAEVNKQVSKQIGFNFQTADLTNGFTFGMGSGRTIPTDKWVIGGGIGVGNGAKSISDAAGNAVGTGVSSVTSGSTMATDGKLFGLNILAALDLAENQGMATTLANPNLTALSGETASFLAGGEVPIPMSSTLGQTSVEFKQYGVSLAFTPTVLADGRISMRVRPEVSQLDDSAGVKVNNFSIPGISTRRAETTVELGSGQSFMIGGLLSSNTSNSVSKTPFLGDVPILGNLFKSTTFRRQQTELVIVVTPYLVRPIDARDAKLPTDGYRNANDAQRYFGAKLHDSKTSEDRPTPTMAPPVTIPAGPPPQSSTGGGSADSTPRKSGKANAAPGFSF